MHLHIHLTYFPVPRGNVSACTWARPAARSGTLAGSSTALSMVSIFVFVFLQFLCLYFSSCTYLQCRVCLHLSFKPLRYLSDHFLGCFVVLGGVIGGSARSKRGFTQ